MSFLKYLIEKKDHFFKNIKTTIYKMSYFVLSFFGYVDTINIYWFETDCHSYINNNINRFELLTNDEKTNLSNIILEQNLLLWCNSSLYFYQYKEDPSMFFFFTTAEHDAGPDYYEDFYYIVDKSFTKIWYKGEYHFIHCIYYFNAEYEPDEKDIFGCYNVYLNCILSFGSNTKEDDIDILWDLFDKNHKFSFLLKQKTLCQVKRFRKISNVKSNYYNLNNKSNLILNKVYKRFYYSYNNTKSNKCYNINKRFYVKKISPIIYKEILYISKDKSLSKSFKLQKKTLFKKEVDGIMGHHSIIFKYNNNIFLLPLTSTKNTNTHSKEKNVTFQILKDIESSLLYSNVIPSYVKHIPFGNCVKLSELDSLNVKWSQVKGITLNVNEFYTQFEKVKEYFTFFSGNKTESITFGKYSISKTEFNPDEDIIELD